MILENIIGLEIHVQLKTKSKMFCRCANAGDSNSPNRHVCPICLAHPGTLPKLNHEAVRLAIKLGLALHANLNYLSQFARKNYYYPDLPKGYQITQDDKPIISGGFLPIFHDNQWKNCEIERMHLEEDSAKNLHSADGQHTLIDFNRAGTPLLEIVTKPNFRFPAEAILFLQELRLTLRALNISDANMEEAQMRCDANISLRPVGDDKYYAKTEVKNLNSFKAIEKALTHEIIRQKELWEAGTPPTVSETRGWDDKKEMTVAQRSKESLNDYRYFPEPDLPLLELNDALVAEARAEIKNLPWKNRLRLMEEYQYDQDLISQLLETPDLLKYLEKTVSELLDWLKTEGMATSVAEAAKLSANWLINRVPPLLKKSGQDWNNLALSAENMAEFLKIILKEEINNQVAGQVLEKMILSKTDADPSHILDDWKNQQADTPGLGEIIEQIVNEHPNEAARYKQGKLELLQFFLGQVMRATRGAYSAEEIKAALVERLS
ncbi:MAG TPA: Asp-tRNA(Asn)/Glu-tRNA(Gln) amidotransferase subunit GatB [bacterium]|nr:Asp-tRNA(Asn)/Glu-tRNA(Gln) amidotransferase subunit GatB [bacterium]